MKEKFLPVLLGTDANAYGMAKSFYEEYQVKSLAIGKTSLIETRNSKIVDVLLFDQFDTQDIFLPHILEIGKKYSEKYEKLILISCGDWYTELIVNNRQSLEEYFIIPYISRQWKERLENKEDFYTICEEYDLPYPKTFIVTKENKKNLDLPFTFPVAVKASNSTSYVKAEFPGKKKGYKAENKEELEKIIDAIYCSSYQESLIIQDFIPGDDTAMWVLNSYSNKNGNVKMMCLGHAILEDYAPWGIGNYKAIISDFNDEIYTKMKDFLEKIGYIGYSNFDMKYDVRDGKYKLFEINIRQGRSSYFTTACGCNLARYIVEDYIENTNKETIYNKNKHLWLAVPKKVLLQYVQNSDILREAKSLIREKKYSYTLLYKKDFNLRRYIMVKRVYFKDFGIFKKYFGKRGMEDE